MFKLKKRTAPTSNNEINDNKASIFVIVKGAFFAVFVSLILVLIFAFIVQFSNMSEKAISPVNQIIKIISILAGVFFCLRKVQSKTLLKGILVGLLYVILSFFVFSILDGTFKISVSIFIDFLFGAIVGGVGAVLFNLIKK